MNRSITLRIIFLLLMIAVTVNAAPVLVVAGKVTDEAGNPVKETFMVRVTNETRNLEETNETNSSGEYTVSFVAESLDQKSVVEAGDTLRISALNNKGESIASQMYQMKTDDVTAGRAVVNMTVQEPVSPIPVLVVSGVVKNDQGSPVSAGVSVQVKNEDRQLSATGKTNADGEYVVTLVAMEGDKIAADVGETISATAQGWTEKHKLTEEDIRDAHVSLDIHPPAELHFARVGGIAAEPDKRLLFEVDEGSELRLKLVAGGGSGDQLTYSADPLSAGASVEDDVFAWTPGFDTVTHDEGQKNFDMTLSVTDGDEEDEQPIRITVHYASNADRVTVSISQSSVGWITR